MGQLCDGYCDRRAKPPRIEPLLATSALRLATLIEASSYRGDVISTTRDATRMTMICQRRICFDILMPETPRAGAVRALEVSRPPMSYLAGAMPIFSRFPRDSFAGSAARFEITSVIRCSPRGRGPRFASDFAVTPHFSPAGCRDRRCSNILFISRAALPAAMIICRDSPPPIRDSAGLPALDAIFFSFELARLAPIRAMASFALSACRLATSRRRRRRITATPASRLSPRLRRA